MTNPVVDQLIGRSNRLGADPKNTNYAGGNTSAKGSGVDPVTGQGLFKVVVAAWCRVDTPWVRYKRGGHG